MPVLGGFCPMPLRLDHGGVSGWSPEQHARVCADLDACVSTVAAIDFRYQKSGATLTVLAYKDQLKVGIANAPLSAAVVNGAGDVTWTFPARWENDFEQSEPIMFAHAHARPMIAVAFGATVELITNSIRVRTWQLSTGTAVDAPVRVRIWTANS